MSIFLSNVNENSPKCVCNFRKNPLKRGKKENGRRKRENMKEREGKMVRVEGWQ
jgi:hypothetical protein